MQISLQSVVQIAFNLHRNAAFLKAAIIILDIRKHRDLFSRPNVVKR